MCAPVPKNKWSWKFEKCIKCGTTKKTGKYIHKGNGLCLSCFDKKRAENPKRKEQLKNQHSRWYLRVKGTELYLAYSRERAKIWCKNSVGRYKRAYRKAQMKKRYIKFLSGNLREMKRNKDCLIVNIDCHYCGKSHRLNSLIKPPEGMMDSENQDLMYRLDMFREIIIELCGTNSFNL